MVVIDIALPVCINYYDCIINIIQIYVFIFIKKAAVINEKLKKLPSNSL